MNRSGLADPSKFPGGSPRTTPASSLSATFDDFLFATVCEERNEMPLSVISVLARLDLDPWAEAAELARMPADGAARRLSSLLAGATNIPPVQLEHGMVAAHLVALLPVAEPGASTRGRAAKILTGPQRTVAGIMWLIFLASMVASLTIGNLTPPGARGPAPGPTPAAAAHR
jgi:hypothetical protein